ncbi:MAG: hypothetical protein JSV21_07935 [Nitrospirota bacterium]|nr:MAG: hypothetical protein JSV21_07935 [Nitrospirota bacterium]
MPSELTRIVKERQNEFKSVLSSNSSTVEKTVTLRRMARGIASDYFDEMHYANIEEFYNDYRAGRSAISDLEGKGVVHGDVLILNNCPMAPLFGDFKDNGDFPGYWSELPQSFMREFKNESILHPLCIVHQSFRDELAKKIPKGNSFVHSVAVACRSGSNGKVVFSEFGLQLSGRSREEIQEAIDGKACAFYVR